jgi:hypothetical protein
MAVVKAGIKRTPGKIDHLGVFVRVGIHVDSRDQIVFHKEVSHLGDGILIDSAIDEELRHRLTVHADLSLLSLLAENPFPLSKTSRQRRRSRSISTVAPKTTAMSLK